MKRVMSVSLGSSKRDHVVETEMLGEKIHIERVGTDGNMARAAEIITRYDGMVDAFGLGGIDLFIHAGGKRYTFRDAKRLAGCAHKTPVVDGSGLKNTLERRVISCLQSDMGMSFKNKRILMVCAVDRFGMAESLWAAGAQMVFGDLIFAFGIPVTITSIKSLQRLASIIAPIAVQLPFKMLYPTGEKQEKVDPKYGKYYEQADIIAGDFHFIRRHMPEDLKGKTIITNTVTESDVDLLRERGVHILVTTTPELQGRSFGTNVMEGVLVALAGESPDMISPEKYSSMLDAIDFKPRVLTFTGQRVG